MDEALSLPYEWNIPIEAAALLFWRLAV